HPDTADRDVCLGVLPPGGGTRTGSRCFTGDPAHANVDVLTEPAPGPDGRFAWLEEHTLRGLITPGSSAIRVGQLTLQDSGQTVRTLPYLSPSGQQIFTATHLAWLGSQALVYVGAEVQYSAPCQRCKLDTLVIGREVTRLDLGANPPALSVIPGTVNATSVWPAPTGDAVYYTIGGDSRVFHQVLASGAVDVIHDFGALGIARDAQVIGPDLVAVVGGRASFQNSPLFGPIQVDSGGFLYHVDLGSGTETNLAIVTHLFRHPALSPDGRLIAAETYDSSAAAPLIADLYLFDAP
ncbi:MAG TPA: hypothetical protein VNH46_06705, partial [Gemmatimonadales bacterium]|nr:hypothetical protein [Gemmatimonadales bacterium]